MSVHSPIDTGCPVMDRDLRDVAEAQGFAASEPDPVLAALDAPDSFGVLDCPLESGLASAALRMPLGAVYLLESQGVRAGFVMQLRSLFAIGVARVACGRDGLWEWDGPEGRLLLAVREEGELVDLVAIQSTDRDSWSLHRGAGWVLGHHWLREARMMGAGVIPIFGTPMAWLAAEGRGICVLDWTASAISALRGLGPAVTLMAENAAAADALANTLRWRGLPGIEVSKNDERRAA